MPTSASDRRAVSVRRMRRGEPADPAPGVCASNVVLPWRGAEPAPAPWPFPCVSERQRPCLRFPRLLRASSPDRSTDGNTASAKGFRALLGSAAVVEQSEEEADRDAELPPSLRAVFEDPPPGRLMGRGHNAGDVLHAYEWELLERSPERLRVRCPLPDGVLNPAGHLFGGFTGTYVDLLSLLAWRASERGRRQGMLMTLNMRIDYVEPVQGTFIAECEVLNRRGRNAWVQTRFVDPDAGTTLVLAWTTLREVER